MTPANTGRKQAKAGLGTPTCRRNARRWTRPWDVSVDTPTTRFAPEFCTRFVRARHGVLACDRQNLNEGDASHRRRKISAQYARARVRVMGLYKWPGITYPTRAAAPARARARLANAAPIRTAVAETMAAFVQDPRRRPADAGLRKPSSFVGSSGVCNAGTACDGTPLLWAIHLG